MNQNKGDKGRMSMVMESAPSRRVYDDHYCDAGIVAVLASGESLL